MHCPECHCPHSSVIKSREAQFTFRGRTRKMRRRECRSCGCRWSTREEQVGPAAAKAPPRADVTPKPKTK